LLSPDGSVLCECGYDFRFESGGGRIASAPIPPIVRTALIAAIPVEFVAWSGFVHILQSPYLFPSWVVTPWVLFGLLIHLPIVGLDRHEPAQAMVMIAVGYVDSAVLAFLVVLVIRAFANPKMRNP
jgi:hypothetical protein